MLDGSVLIENFRFSLMIERLCLELIEKYGDFENTCFIGIQPRGVVLSDRMMDVFDQLSSPKPQDYGKLDITFYRDDFRTRDKPLSASKTEMNFLIEGKKVILVDDVLYTGRTISAALNALLHYGRPDKVELLVLVDRRFNREVPVTCDYVGTTVDALSQEYVKVEWKEIHGEDKILFYSGKSAQ